MDKCTANTGPSPNCGPLAHVRWNFKWCCFLWRRLICPQNSSLRMFWYRDLNSSYFFPRFGTLEHAANRTPGRSATVIGSRKEFCKRNGMSVCSARKRKASILSVSYKLNRFNRLSRWKTTPLQILCQNMVRTWYSTTLKKKTLRKKTSLLFLSLPKRLDLIMAFGRHDHDPRIGRTAQHHAQIGRVLFQHVKILLRLEVVVQNAVLKRAAIPLHLPELNLVRQSGR